MAILPITRKGQIFSQGMTQDFSQSQYIYSIETPKFCSQWTWKKSPSHNVWLDKKPKGRVEYTLTSINRRRPRAALFLMFYLTCSQKAWRAGSYHRALGTLGSEEAFSACSLIMVGLSLTALWSTLSVLNCQWITHFPRVLLKSFWFDKASLRSQSKPKGLLELWSRLQP